MIKLAAQQYLYSIDEAPLEHWSSEGIRTALANGVAFLPHEVYECMKPADITFEILHLETVMKESTKKVNACIPFQGFYESTISGYLDDELEFNGGQEPNSWADVHRNVAESYTEHWAEVMSLPVEFVKLIRPREYNFETDRIEVEVSEECVAGIRAGLLQNERFREYIFESCSHRDGFISFLPADLDDWNDVWGYKEVSRAFEFLELEEYRIEERIIEDMHCNGGFSW